MNIQVKCFATLSDYTPDDPDAFEVPEGATAADVMASLGVPEHEVKIIFINGRKVEPGAELADGDRLGLFPAVGGG
jgi:sulfur carrier protein ThiS